jgi:hypothetical protein
MPGPGGDMPAPLPLGGGELSAKALVLKSASPKDRMEAFGRISALLGTGAPLQPDAAEAVATYLVTPKALRPELDSMAGQLGPVVANREIKLAFADLLPASQVPLQQAEKIISAMFNEDVKLGTDPQWKAAARQRVLRAVLGQLGGSSVYDRVEDALRTLYKEQGLLLGMDPSAFSGDAGVAGNLERVTRFLAGKLAQEDVDEAARATLQRVPHEVQAAEFLAASDVQRTALLQRTWAQVLAIYVARQKPDQAAAAQEQVKQLLDGDAKAASVVQQIYAGETTLLRLWLLLNG